MAKGDRKRREELEQRRLDEIEAEEARLLEGKGVCMFCGRKAKFDKHDSLHKRMKWEKKFDDSIMCLQCHAQLHWMLKNKRELCRTLQTVEDIVACDEFQKYLKWAEKRPPETVYH